MEIFFPKRPQSEILVREKNFRPPQTRRQVSATDKYNNYFLSFVSKI